MLLYGDEIGRTQGGNNNAYCQDNEISWIDWEHADRDLLAFTASLIALRREHPVFHRRRYFLGQPIHGTCVSDIGWHRPDGMEMSAEDWTTDFSKSLAVFLSGRAPGLVDSRGQQVIDDDFYIAFNAHHEQLLFTLPANLTGLFRIVLNTAEAVALKTLPKRQTASVLRADPALLSAVAEGEYLGPEDTFLVEPRSVVMLSSTSWA
jgi:glycogen operon protein